MEQTKVAMSLLGTLRAEMEINLNIETLSAYHAQVIREWREARERGWYATKCMRESDLVDVGHMMDKLGANTESYKGILARALAA